MIIKHINNYLSIKKFEEFEMDDFSVITGLNGSGKTHFFKAIKENKVKIDEIDSLETVYYNNETFRVDDSIKPNNNSRNRLSSQRTLDILTKIKTETDNEFFLEKEINDKYIFDYIIKKEYNFDSFFNADDGIIEFGNVDILQEYRDAIMRDDKRFNYFVCGFIMNFPNLKALANYNLEKLKQKFNEIEKEYLPSYNSKFELKLKQKNNNLYSYLKKNSTENYLIKLVNGLTFTSTDIILNQIAKAEKKYQFIKLKNSFYKTLSNDGIRERSFLNEIDFKKKYGNSPITCINHILNEYNCNGYQLKSNKLDIDLGVSIDSIDLNIELINKRGNYETSFDQLSSGEKILINLFLIIHKIEKKITPRILLLDEIDASLHPSMIRLLLKVINKKIVIEKKIKVIIATHSINTIALFPGKNIYLIDNKKSQLFTKQNKDEAIKVLSEGFVTLSEGFSIFNNLNENKLTLLTEGNNINYIKKAIRLIKPELLGHIDFIESLKGRTGKTQLKTMFDFFKKTKHSGKKLFIFDCDVDTINIDDNNTFSYTFNKNKSNGKVLKGIENLFDEDLFSDKFYTRKSKDDGGYSYNLDKKEFEKYIYERGTKEIFYNFRELIVKIDNLIKLKN